MFKVLVILFLVTLFNLHAGAFNVNDKIKIQNHNSDHLKNSEIDEFIKSLERQINAKELSSKELNVAEEKSQEDAKKKQNFQSSTPSSYSSFHFVPPNSRDRVNYRDESDFSSVETKPDLHETYVNSNPQAQNHKLQEQDAILKEIRKELDDLRNERTILSDLPAYRNQLTNSEKQERYYSSLVRLQNLYHLYNERYLNDDLTAANEDQQQPNYGEFLPKKMEYLNSAKLRHLEESRLLADRIAESAMHLATNKFAEKTAKRGVGAYGAIDPYEDFETKMIMPTAANEMDFIVTQIMSQGKSASDDPDYERRILGLAYDLVNAATIRATSGKEENKNFFGDKEEKIDEYLKSTLPRDDLYDPKVQLSNSGFDYVNHPDDEYVGSARKDGEQDIVARNNFRKEQSKTPKEKKIHHLDNRPQQKQRSGGVWEDVNKLYNFNDYENNKFINLSMDCSGKVGEALRPECDRLKLELYNPGGTEPVPLGYVKKYLNHGRELAVDMHDRGRALHREIQQVRPAPGSPSMLQYVNDQVTESSIQINLESQNVLFSLKVLEEKMITDYDMTKNTFFEFLRHHNIHVTGSQICRPRPNRCNSLSKYRSADGSCNNLRNPSWGKSNTGVLRLLPARYSDGIHAIARSVSGKPLPNPRTLSSQLFTRRSSPDRSLTQALLHWGQMVEHDFSRLVSDQTVSGGIECCQRNGRGPVPKSMQHHSCLPIDVSPYDQFYGHHNQTCMNFVRSMTVAQEDCSLDAANQLNAVSSYLDLSPIYSGDQVMSEVLREFRYGRLRTETRDNRVMMPTATGTTYCGAQTNQDICYLTGDVRSNQNPGLVVLHALLVREHNRVAYELAILNPHWNDERLYQEARRVVIAEYQHITYQHWLPLVLGKSYAKAHGVVDSSEELSQDYDIKIDPSAINGFSAAAFRFLHSTVQGEIELFENGTKCGSLRLSDHYYQPRIVEVENNFESLFRGMVEKTIQKPDMNFDKEVSEYFYRSTYDFGLDLVALDIQRGRDHGLPSYNDYRKKCQLDRATDFHDLINEMSLVNLEKLQHFYEDVNDVDLFVGAIMESKGTGSLLGPTMQCLIGEQFYRAKAGDRYFYSHANQQSSFTSQQFEEIKKTSLATLLCDSSDALSEIQENPFLVNSYQNPIKQCYELPRMNLRYWKEEMSY